MNSTVTVSTRKAMVITPIFLVLPVAGAFYGTFLIGQSGSFTQVGQWIYESAEWLGPSAIVLALAVSWLMEQLERPFTHVPFDAPWWEFAVFGLFAATAGIVICASILTAVLLFTILIPVKAIIVYALGEGATIASALIAIPLAYFGVGLGFLFIYLVMLLNGSGNLLKDGTALFPGPQKTGWLPAARDTLYYSLATMIGADSAGLSATGPVRWVALAQSTVARALEIVIVGVGITLILERM